MNTITNLLPATTIMFACALGCLLFYIFEFLANKKIAGFNFMTWVKDNWLKILILSPLCLIAYVKFVDPAITEQSAFIVGLGVSGIIDQIQDMAKKPKT